MTDDTQVILEHFDDKFSALIENIDTLISVKVKPLVEDLKTIKQDVSVIKAAVGATNHIVLVLEKRVAQLESR